MNNRNETKIPTTPQELQAFADLCKPGALAFAEAFGLSIEDASGLAAMLALFAENNRETFHARIAAGEDQDQVMREFLAAFSRDCLPALQRWTEKRSQG